MRGFKVLLATGAVAVATAGIVIVASPSNPSSQASDRPDEGTVPALTARQQQAADHYAKLPVSFVENQGQTDARVRYYAQGNGYGFFLTPSEVVLSFAKDSTRAADSARARARAAVRRREPEGRAAGFRARTRRGQRPARRRSEPVAHAASRSTARSSIQTCGRSIDLRLREQSGVLKYEFHVRPGASPSDIQLAYGGADGLALSDDGGLRIATPLGVLRDSAPLSYQDIDGVRVPVTSRYVLDDDANATAGSRSPSAATSATTSWSSTPACSTRPSSAATAPRPAPASPSTRPATPSSPARRSRPTSRRPPARSIAPAQRRTSPTSSSPS